MATSRPCSFQPLIAVVLTFADKSLLYEHVLVALRFLSDVRVIVCHVTRYVYYGCNDWIS